MRHKQYWIIIPFLIIFSLLIILSSEAICSEKKDKKPAAAESSVDYRLLGTVSGGKVTPAWAFIEEADSIKQGKWYKLNDRLDDGSGILKVRRGEVVLKKGNKQKILILEGPLTKRAIVSLSPTHKVVKKYDAFTEIGNLSGLSKLVEIKPHFNADGEFAFLVDGIENGSLVELAGLKNGDLIRAANGQKFSTPQKTIQILRKVRNQPQIDVELLRSNKSVKLHYDLK